jgi:hypothetical protein
MCSHEVKLMIRQHVIIVACALALTGAAMASAPASGPAGTASGAAAATTTAATSMPAADYSTPTATVKSYLRAVNAGDNAGIHAALQVSDEHKADLDALLSLTISQHWLQEAAATHFKNGGDKVFYGDPKTRVTLADQLKVVDDATLDTAGDSATLNLPASDVSKEPQKIALKKIGGEWKIDAVSLYSLDSDKTPARVALAKKLAAVTDATLKDLAAGKFGSSNEAYQEYWTRMKEASQALAPATSATAAANPAK